MSMISEFKRFAMRGNVVDMAVGIIIGTAFGKIVSSLVNDVVMPPVGVLLGGVDFSGLAITVRESVGDAPPVVIKYGAFINTVVDFLIVALSIFIVIRGMNKMIKKAEAPPPTPTRKDCPECLMTIPIKATRCGHCGVAVK